jgi:hypothetical protein
MKILAQLFFRLGMAAIFLTILSFILPFIGMQIKGGALGKPIEKLYAFLIGIGLIGFGFLISLIGHKKGKG